MNKSMAGASLFTFLSTCNLALSQVTPPAPAERDQLVAIVVTAQRREERLQDVPISATVTSGGDLERSNITGIQDLAARLPDVKISEGTVDVLNIRGVGSGSNAGFEQDVGTFVDGVYRERARAVRAALFDVDQVEVLKGPQSTFFGNNTIAGALNISTRKPGDTFDYNGSVLYGSSIGEYAVEGGVTAPLTDTLSVRLAGEAFGQKGWVYNQTLDEEGPHDRDWVGRVSFAWKPTEDWRTDLRVDHDHRWANNLGPELLGCPPTPALGAAAGSCATTLANNGGFNEGAINSRTFTTEQTFEKYDMTEVALTNRVAIGRYSLSSITGYFTHYDQLVPSIGPFDAAGVEGESENQSASFEEHYHSVSQEFRLASPTDGLLSYQVGTYFSHGELSQPSYFGFYFAPFGPTPLAAFIPFDQYDTTFSEFGAATLHFTDDFRFNVGLRYSEVEKTAYSVSTFGTGGSPLTHDNYVAYPAAFNEAIAPFLGAQLGSFPTPSRRDSKLMPSASLQYAPTSDIMSYVSYTNGFKAGGYGVSFTRNEFKPETVNSYEVGLKGTALDRHLSFAVDAFLSNYDELQETTNTVLANGALLSQITNAAQARSKGVEVNIEYKLNHYVAFSANVANLNARYINYANAPCTILQSALPGCTQDLSGKHRAFAPDYSGNVASEITVPLIRDLQLRVEPMVYITTKYYEQATIDPLLLQGGYAKLDVRAGVGSDDGKWEVAMVAKNLTDKLTASYRNSTTGGGPSVASYPDAPRTIAIQVSVKH